MRYLFVCVALTDTMQWKYKSFLGLADLTFDEINLALESC